MAENASQSIKNPWLLGDLSAPKPSAASARWPISVLAPIKFMAGSAPVVCVQAFRRFRDMMSLNLLSMFALDMLNLCKEPFTVLLLRSFFISVFQIPRSQTIGPILTFTIFSTTTPISSIRQKVLFWTQCYAMIYDEGC